MGEEGAGEGEEAVYPVAVRVGVLGVGGWVVEVGVGILVGVVVVIVGWGLGGWGLLGGWVFEV